VVVPLTVAPSDVEDARGTHALPSNVASDRVVGSPRLASYFNARVTGAAKVVPVGSRS
jgi:hypothetical protein